VGLPCLNANSLRTGVYCWN